ncbi:acyl carrier protein [Streptomyces sp. NPDC001933]|uniref:acyl carrier protein n=1 Tax=Streptomyces sp. NPDC001933 TaxID=3364626 RepID=UPI0036C534D2
MTADPAHADLAWLIELMKITLDVPTINPSLSPRDYGMDSLGAVELCIEIKRRYGIPVEQSWEWVSFPVDEIAQQLAARRRAPTPD